MATGPNYALPYKRKRLSKTNYKKRLGLVKSEIPRLVVRRSNKKISTQVIEFHLTGDKTLVSATSMDLEKYGFPKPGKNLPSSYLTGYLIGKLAMQKKVKKCVLDIGLNVSTKGNKFYAVLQGALDAGLTIPAGKEIMPDPKRIRGEHIKGFNPSTVELVKKNIDAKVK